MPSEFPRLLAKSRKLNEVLTPSMLLIGHLQDVYASALRVLDATGEDQLRALGLEPGIYIDRFRRCVLLAAAIHDLGKANDHFQGMLAGERNVLQNPQGLRHEWVSILMAQPLKEWLLPALAASETDFSIVEWAVAGHHPSPAHDSPPKTCPFGAGIEVQFLLGHPDCEAILNWLARMFPALSPSARPTCRSVRRTLAESHHVFAEISKLWGNARRIWEERIEPTKDRRLVCALKNCLVAADIAGSALPKAKPMDATRWEWITEASANRPKPGDLDAICRARLGDSPPRDFQRQVAEATDSVILVKAGCGSGKTVAAYMWAARNHPTRRLYFCYPTTGTATEGFKDYLFEPDGELGDLGARLFHSRRDIDFEIILDGGLDIDGRDREEVAKLESLEAWSTPIVACTVDTVLGVIQNNRRGLFAWPALAQSAFIFDEIHSYDDRLFGALLRFLSDLPGLPALLMTASLPRHREDALQSVLAERSVVLRTIEGPPDLERLPRYYKASTNDPLRLVQNEFRHGGKILWVCNTVARVMETADCTARAGLNPRIYHSRFKYVDRVTQHKAVIEAFTPEQTIASLAVCTQVAEMSLDLKGCTMLVTDLAPVPPLIQRLGRLNRQAKEGSPTRPFVVIEPDKPSPYEASDLETARAWLGRLPSNDISQRQLSECWEQSGDDEAQTVASAWLDGGPVTTVCELREASPGISILMREDVDAMTPSKGSYKDIGRYVIPMPQPPREVKWQTWSKFKGIPIAEPGFVDYDKCRGAQWQLQRNVSPRII